MLIRLAGCQIIDPTRPDNGSVGDIWMRGETIVDPPVAGIGGADGSPQAAEPVRTLDATGCVVMAGGIDLHTHIGGGKVTLARMLLGDQMPPWRIGRPHAGDSGENDFLPSASVTARRYLDMGYTTCFEPAVIPCNARSAHGEMADVRGIDTGGYCLLGNDEVLLNLIADGAEQAVINRYVAWMVAATGCIAVKVVNAGGIDAFKYNVRQLDVDTPHPRYAITPGAIIRTLCRAVHEIGLTHPLHVHCSNLGVPGNIRSTLATIAAADGYPIHLTHVQFHCYGDGGPHGMSSAAAELVDAMRRHPNVTVDVGQIQFGRTVTISADSMHQFENIAHAKPRKSILVDIECEAGCGVVPFRYHRREFVHCLQWAIGLELFLMIDDPSRVFLTTDHPNGAPFTAYPHFLGLLSDASFRATALAEIHPDAAATSSLAGLDREYSLCEIATMTRSAPAQILGLTDRGHLRPGGIADVVVYDTHENRETMFSKPRWVFKSGQLIRDSGRDLAADSRPPDRTLAAALPIDRADVSAFAALHAKTGTYAMDRLWIDDDEWPEVLGSQKQFAAPGNPS